MRSKHHSDTLADITFLAGDKDAPAKIRTAANNALTAYAIAVKTANDSRTDQLDTAADLDLLRARTANDLADDLINGKSISIDKSVDKINKQTDKHNRADDIYTIAHRLQSVAKTRCGQIIKDNRTDLIIWCGRKRAADLTRCGEILPDAVWRIWQTLDVRFHNITDDALTVDAWRNNGKISTLPIEWYDTWTDPARASLAWIFNEIASANFVTLKTNNDSLIRLTQQPIELPQVPRAKPTPKTEPIGWYRR